MKRFLAAIVAGVACLVAEPGAEKSSVGLTWDEPDVDEGIRSYQFFAITNLPTDPRWIWNASTSNWVTYFPVPSTNWIKFAQTNVTEPKTNARILVADLPGYTNGFRGPWFITMTASNLWGESDFSNVAWMPKKPVSRDRRLQIGL